MDGITDNQAMNALQEKLQRLQQFQQADPSNSQLLHDIGRTHMQLHQFQEALSAFDAALAIRPEAIYAFDKATAWLAMEQYPQAKALLENLLEQGIDNAGIRFNLAYASTYLGDSTASAEHLQHLSEEDLSQIPMPVLSLPVPNILMANWMKQPKPCKAIWQYGLMMPLPKACWPW